MKVHLVEIIDTDNTGDYWVVISINNVETRYYFSEYKEAHEFVDSISKAAEGAKWR